MQIHGSAHVHGAQAIGAPHTLRINRPQEPGPASQAADEVQISSASQFLESVHELPAVRLDRIEQIRAEIASGTYLTGDKLDIALDRLLDEIG